MLSMSKIREDLKKIRYYYTRREVLEPAFGETGTNTVVDTVRKYNKAVLDAPPRLYDVYASLYVRGFTQEALAAELNFSVEYIQMLNVRLVKFLQTRIEE